MKKIAVIIISVLLLIILLVALRNQYWQREAGRAKLFCEEMIPQIEQYRNTHDEYPSQLDPAWLAGREIPKLIDTDTFYLKTPAGYLLRYRNPAEFWDDVFGYHGSPDGGNWVQYDGY